MDRRKASKAPLVQTSLSLLPCSTHWEPQRQGQSGSSSALSPPDTGRNQTQASQTHMGTWNKRSSHPTSSMPQGNSHLVTPSAPLLLPPPLHSLHHPVLPCTTRSPPLCHEQMPSPSSLIKPHAGPGVPPDPAPAAPQTQAECMAPFQRFPGCGHSIRGARPTTTQPFTPPHEQRPRHESPGSAAQTAQVYFLSNSLRLPRWTCCVCLQHASLPPPSRCAVPAAGGPSHLAGRCGAVSARISLRTKKPCVTQNLSERGVLLLRHSRIHV